MQAWYIDMADKIQWQVDRERSKVKGGRCKADLITDVGVLTQERFTVGRGNQISFGVGTVNYTWLRIRSGIWPLWTLKGGSFAHGIFRV